MKLLRVIVTFLIIGTPVFAQEAKEIIFQEMEHDFGSVQEGDGPVIYEFVFTNTSAAPVKILGVRPSCGCTTPDWTKEEVAPGKTGFVKAQFNPFNRPGPFNKTLTVSATTNQRIILRIKGAVIPRVKTTEELFPVMIGSIRFTNTALNMGRITPASPVVKEFIILNAGDSEVQFLPPANLLDHLKIEVPSEPVPVGEKGTISVTYDAKIKDDFGALMDNIVIKTDEELKSEKALKIYATVDPYIPPMTPAQRAMAPSLVMDKSIVDLGTIQQGSKAEGEVVLKNNGKSPLEIIKAKPSCVCTILSLPENSIEPGQEITLKITFDATGIRGTQQKYITLFTNDPAGPAKRIILKGVVN